MGKTCSIIEISCRLETDVVRKIQVKEGIHESVIKNLQTQYSRYTFNHTFGATCVSTCLQQSIAELGFVGFVGRQILNVQATIDQDIWDYKHRQDLLQV